MTPAPLSIALVGAGNMGSLHARVISQSAIARLSAVVDPDPEQGRRLADRFGTGWLAELDDPTAYDAVVVAAPTPSHAAIAEPVIAAGVPLLVEKPITADLATTEAIVGAAHRADVPLMCGLLERYNPAVRTALRIVGDPIHVTSVRHSPYAPRITTGVAYDLLIHDVDLVLTLTGAEPSRVDAHFATFDPRSLPGAEDVAEVVLSFDHGAVASLSASRVAQRKVRSLVIAELERVVEVDLVRQDLTVYRHVGDLEPSDDGAGYRQQTIIDIPTIHDAREPLAVQLERFVALARGEIDPGEERDTLLAPHRVVAAAVRTAATIPDPGR